MVREQGANFRAGRLVYFHVYERGLAIQNYPFPSFQPCLWMLEHHPYKLFTLIPPVYYSVLLEELESHLDTFSIIVKYILMSKSTLDRKGEIQPLSVKILLLGSPILTLNSNRFSYFPARCRPQFLSSAQENLFLLKSSLENMVNVLLHWGLIIKKKNFAFHSHPHLNTLFLFIFHVCCVILTELWPMRAAAEASWEFHVRCLTSHAGRGC